jgi:hypothetical protein
MEGDFEGLEEPPAAVCIAHSIFTVFMEAISVLTATV